MLLISTHFINFNIYQPTHIFQWASIPSTALNFTHQHLQKLKSFFIFLRVFPASSLAVYSFPLKGGKKRSISFIINVFMCTFPLRFIYAVTCYEWNNLQVCQKNIFFFFPYLTAFFSVESIEPILMSTKYAWGESKNK